MVDWTRQERLEILKAIFTEVHSVRRESESLETRVGIGAFTAILVLGGVVIRGDLTNISSRYWIALFIALFSVLVSWFLRRHSARVKSCCRMLVRIEHVMDLYRPHAYFTPEEEKSFPNEPNYGDGVYPEWAKGWGTDDHRLSRLPFTVSVLAAGLLVAVAVTVIQPQREAVPPYTSAEESVRSEEQQDGDSSTAIEGDATDESPANK